MDDVEDDEDYILYNSITYEILTTLNIKFKVCWYVIPHSTVATRKVPQSKESYS
jgi:DNA-directed RNA polymerase subunit L